MAIKREFIEEPGGKYLHGCLQVAVVFTNVQHTLESLQVAGRLTADLAPRIELLVEDEAGKRSVSTITPITLAHFTSRYFLTMLPHKADLQIRVTRYPAFSEDLWEVLPPHSIIVMTGRNNRFWPSAQQRFARKLDHAGHEVILLSPCSESADVMA